MGEKGTSEEVVEETPGRIATVPRPPTGDTSIADGDKGGGRRARTPGGAPSGSITHPGGRTLEKDDSGAWTYRGEDGTVARWDDGAGAWRDAGSGTTVDLPPPDDLARRLSLGPD